MNPDDELTLKEKLRRLPSSSGVYLMKDRFGQIIYIGKAVNLKRRVSNYFGTGALARAHGPKIASLVSSIFDFEIFQVKTDAEAVILESKLIKRWRPRYNTLEKDDKNFVLLKIETFKELPRFVLCRQVKEDGALYYGPYLNSSALRSTINHLKKDFGIISSDAKPIKISETQWQLYDDARAEIFTQKNILTEEEYTERVNAAIDFLNNQSGEIIASLEMQMAEASAEENFEKAARLRDAIFAISETNRLRNPKADPSRSSASVAEEAMLDLSRALNMKHKPSEIECFDISHISGSYSVASMVRFENGMPTNSKYRRFKLSTGNDDFQSMREAIERRYAKLQEEGRTLPDLIVIDGGKGQVSSALDAFEILGITPPKVIGLAKKEETIISSDFEEILLPRRNEGLKLLQRLRDEAHRFANSYREVLQRKKLKESILDGFEGMGETRKNALLEKFGSIAKIKKASPEELAETDGISLETATRLCDFLSKIKNKY